MGIRIPLPSIAQKEARAHPYPFQISIQTQKFVQASLFHATIVDTAKSEYMRLPGSFQRIESTLIQHSFSRQAINESWSFMEEYREVLKGTVYQNVLISLNSHWDWYVRKLAVFVSFARKHIDSPTLTKHEKNNLERIGFISIPDQLKTLERACGVEFGLEASDIESMREMSLLRNLGLHNRWEVDEKYLQNSACKTFAKDEIRTVEEDELESWHASLIKALSETAKIIAVKYAVAPDFP